MGAFYSIEGKDSSDRLIVGSSEVSFRISVALAGK